MNGRKLSMGDIACYENQLNYDILSENGMDRSLNGKAISRSNDILFAVEVRGAGFIEIPAAQREQRLARCDLQPIGHLDGRLDNRDRAVLPQNRFGTHPFLQKIKEGKVLKIYMGKKLKLGTVIIVRLNQHGNAVGGSNALNALDI